MTLQQQWHCYHRYYQCDLSIIHTVTDPRPPLQVSIPQQLPPYHRRYNIDLPIIDATTVIFLSSMPQTSPSYHWWHNSDLSIINAKSDHALIDTTTLNFILSIPCPSYQWYDISDRPVIDATETTFLLSIPQQWCHSNSDLPIIDTTKVNFLLFIPQLRPLPSKYRYRNTDLHILMPPPYHRYRNNELIDATTAVLLPSTPQQWHSCVSRLFVS